MSKVLYVQKDTDISDYKVEERFEFDDHLVLVVNDEGQPGAEKFDTERTHEGVEHIEDEFDAEPMWETAVTANSTGKIADMELVRSFHNVQDRSESNHVILMDSGIDANHLLFEGMDIRQHTALEAGVPEEDPQDHVGHGTACAGQITQLNPDVDLDVLRIFGDRGSTGTRTILRAYEWLNNNASDIDVVNMSWGTSNDSPTINKVHEKLVSKGVQDVVAAGNSGGRSGSPGTSDNAYSVGSCNLSGSMSDFSSYNPDMDNPEITALGENMRVARAEGTSMGEPLGRDYTVASGTSFAAPEVTGLVSGYTNPQEMADALVHTARDIEGTPRDGSGIVDHTNALDGMVEPEPEPDPEPEPGTEEELDAHIVNFFGNNLVFIDGSPLGDGNTTAEVRDDGSIILRQD